MDCWLWSRNCYCHNFWRCTVLGLWVSQESTSSNVSLLPPSGSIFIYIRADKHACDFQHLLLFFFTREFWYQRDQWSKYLHQEAASLMCSKKNTNATLCDPIVIYKFN